MFDGAALMLGHRFHHETGFENRVSGVAGILRKLPQLPTHWSWCFLDEVQPGKTTGAV